LCGFKISKMNLKIIFTWWNNQTLGTFLKTLFSGIYVGKDELGNKYYKNKKNERWIIYSGKIEATKITSDWYLWMHHTIDKIPDDKDKKKEFLWQKNHEENKTGTKFSYKPIKIKKDEIKKKYETWK
jgi:NADH:ubiquinone oxidoreductase subunit